MNKKLSTLIISLSCLILSSVADAKKEKTRFFVVGDTGTGDSGQKAVAKAIEDKCKKDGCEFGIFLGDNIYNSGVSSVDDKQFITKFEEPYKNLDMKMYMTLGNHDYRGNVEAEIQYTKKSTKWVMPSRNYNFKIENTEFFCIDTNNPTKDQTEDLVKKVRKSNAKWKIAFGHHPRYTNGVYRNAEGMLKELLDKALCKKVNLYLSGHEHNKQHLKKSCGVNHLILGSGAGTRPWLMSAENTLFAKDSLGFGWFEIDDSTIHFEVLDTNGKVEYKYDIN